MIGRFQRDILLDTRRTYKQLAVEHGRGHSYYSQGMGVYLDHAESGSSESIHSNYQCMRLGPKIDDIADDLRARPRYGFGLLPLDVRNRGETQNDLCDINLPEDMARGVIDSDKQAIPSGIIGRVPRQNGCRADPNGVGDLAMDDQRLDVRGGDPNIFRSPPVVVVIGAPTRPLLEAVVSGVVRSGPRSIEKGAKQRYSYVRPHYAVLWWVGRGENKQRNERMKKELD